MLLLGASRLAVSKPFAFHLRSGEDGTIFGILRGALSKGSHRSASCHAFVFSVQFEKKSCIFYTIVSGTCCTLLTTIDSYNKKETRRSSHGSL